MSTFKFSSFIILTLITLGCESNDDSVKLTLEITPENSGVLVLPGLSSIVSEISSDTITRSTEFIFEAQDRSIEIKALPVEGYKFVEWENNGTFNVTSSEDLSSPTQYFDLNKDRVPSAAFAEKLFKLSENGVTVICDGADFGDAEQLIYAAGITEVFVEYTVTKRTKSEITEKNEHQSCTSGITNMDELFLGSLERGVQIRHWDVSKVTSMNLMFHNGNAEGYFGGWDVSNVTNMNGMFWSANYMVGLGMENWDVSNVTDMGYMFRNNIMFNTDISGWDVSNVTNMKGMFLGARDFNQDLTGWCVSKIPSKPLDFAPNLPLERHPVWGTCPQ